MLFIYLSSEKVEALLSLCSRLHFVMIERSFAETNRNGLSNYLVCNLSIAYVFNILTSENVDIVIIDTATAMRVLTFNKPVIPEVF
ncbi:hypothetical protein CXF72_06355 [Psychromonas sp. MB-3u-54]|nr:hypothetical protein CXF72_06355 [Psychromonas sp. MB-3u-54]